MMRKCRPRPCCTCSCRNDTIETGNESSLVYRDKSTKKEVKTLTSQLLVEMVDDDDDDDDTSANTLQPCSDERSTGVYTVTEHDRKEYVSTTCRSIVGRTLISRTAREEKQAFRRWTASLTISVMMCVVIFANVAIAFAPTSCRIIRKSTQTSRNHLVSSGAGRFRSSYVVQYAINSTIQDAPDQKLATKHSKSPTPTKTTKEKSKPKPTAEPTRKSNVDKKGEWYYWSNESDMAVIESNHPQTKQLDPSSSPSPGQKQQVSRLRFTVRGNPRPLQRHRTSRGFMYNPSLKYQTSFQHVVKNLLVGNESDSNDRPSSLTYPIFGPDEYLVMNIVFKMKRPKSHFVNNKPGHGRLKVSSTGMMSSTIRTDIDNLVKFVLDSMNEVLYEDDRQIVSIQATKVFDNDDTCEGSIDVNIRRIETDDDMDEIIRSSFK